MNRYKTSSGEWITKAQIDRNTRDAKTQLIANQYQEHGYNFCITCLGKPIPESANDMECRILDCAHIISVKECQEIGRAELCWDLNNMIIECRYHHKIRDGLNLKFKNK